MESICNTEEMEWFANADFSMYEGKYIAIQLEKMLLLSGIMQNWYGKRQKENFLGQNLL